MDDSLQQTMVLDAGDDSHKMVGMFTVSALGHLVFFILLMVMPTAMPSSYSLAPAAISVDLVSMPAGEPAPTAPAVEPEPTPAVEPEAPPEAVSLPEPEPEPEAVSIAPQPAPAKVVKSLKKQTKKKKTAQKPAVEKPKPPAAPARERQVSKAIESMRQKVATQEKARTTGGSGSGGGGGGGGAAILSRIQNYRLEAALAVAQNWAFSQELAGVDADLVTLIKFRVLPNGDVTDIDIVQSSGNRYLDESALRAIQKASPVAPHPEGIGRPYIEVGIRATPAGVR